jgi:thiamine biosynthesis lipoprotein
MIRSLLSFEAPDQPTDLSLLRVSRQAMATTFEVILPVEQPLALAAGNDALDLIDDLEDQLTVYRDHSEVSRLNARAPKDDVPVEAELFALLSRAAMLTRETAGAFDIATGALSKVWGFTQRAGRAPTVAERKEAMRRTGMKHVIFDPRRRTVRYRRDGLEINLGGIGKGYALDRVAARLRSSWNATSGLLHGGSSSVRVLGPPPNGEAGWTIAIRHPWNLTRMLGAVRLGGGGLGTSAATHQFFEYDGRKLGHLLDPRNAWPAEKIQQATVIAPTAEAADALSTAFFVMGLEDSRIYCQSRPNIHALIWASADEEPVVLNPVPGLWTPA